MYIATVPNREKLPAGPPPARILARARTVRVKNRTLANLSHWPAARLERFPPPAGRGVEPGRRDCRRAPNCKASSWSVLLALRPEIRRHFSVPRRRAGRSRVAKLGFFLVLRASPIRARACRRCVGRGSGGGGSAGTGKFDEDDLCAALDDLAARQEKMEKTLYRRYLARRGQPPRLFLYDVTSSYLEGGENELGAYGYNRDGSGASCKLSSACWRTRKASRWRCGCSKGTAVIPPPWQNRSRFCRNNSG